MTHLQELVKEALCIRGYLYDAILSTSCAAPVMKGKTDMYVFGLDGHIACMSLDCKTLEMIHKA